MNKTIQDLVAALADRDPEIRYEAARLLGDFGPEAVDAVPALTAALKDRWVFAVAREALKRILPSSENEWGNDALGG